MQNTSNTDAHSSVLDFSAWGTKFHSDRAADGTLALLKSVALTTKDR